MTIEEAKKVAEICITADGGCCYCTKDLFEQLNDKFPEFKWAIVDSYDGTYEVKENGPKTDVD